jgi:CBS domain-containing protein
MMASHPRWCRPLDEWRRHLRGFIREAEPQARLELASFLDFRCVAGQAELARTLRAFVGEELAGTPALLPLLARDVAQYRPPKGLFGGLSAGPGGIDTKDVAAAIESVARLYALSHRLPETSTFDRLRRLEEVGAVSATGHEELAQAYGFVMTLRLRRQVSRLGSGQPADNEVDPRSLNHLEEGLLKQVLSLLGTFQKKIQSDFLGGAGL